MKTLIKIFIFIFCFTKTVSAQTVGTAPPPTKEYLIKYCGNYIPSEYETQVGPMSIILKEGKLYRRLDDDNDKVLIPTSNNMFVYGDDSKRKVEFTLDNKGKVVSVILTRPDGEFILQKTK
jgi:hypothetical protein